MRDITSIDFDKIAVVLVDLQRGYCDPSSDAAIKLNWDVQDANRVCQAHVPFLAALRTTLRPAQIIWLRMEEAPETYAKNTSYGPHRANDFVSLCVRGTPGHDYHIIQPAPEEAQFLKFHPSGFSNKNFRAYLEDHEIKQLAFTGVVSSRCVNATVVAASALGYECVLINNLISGPTEHQIEMNEHVKLTTFFYAQAVESDRFLNHLRNRAF
jgi:nicotinamidase-related amidase